ncbi:MAG: DUF4919 domain-containing protein, partial [Tannerellaceae bacterium]|nr:DUF4919 domain-containing protein [Tannerellaceae bacterium]
FLHVQMKVMRFTIFLFCLIGSFQTVCPQIKGGRFDLSLVEQFVKQGDEYDKLLDRMGKGDNSLTTTEYRYIYYGFQFREEYTGSLDTVHYHIGELIEKKNFREAFDVSKKALEVNPVSLRLLLYCIQAGRELGLPGEQLSLYTKPFLEFTYIIALSGNGNSERTAFKVLSITDEYVMMQFYFGITEVLDQEVMEWNGRIYDCLHITPTPDYDSDIIYFDVTPSMLKMAEIYGEE